MSKAIKNTEVIQKDIFQNSIDSAIALEGILKKILQLLKKDLKGIKFDSADSFKKFNEVQKETVKTTTQLSVIEKERLKLMKQQETLNAKQITQKSKLSVQNEKLKQDVQKQAKATKDLVKWQKAEINSVDKLMAANALLTKRRDAVNTSTEKGRKRIIALNKVIDKNNAKILKNADAMKKQRLNIGNYGSAVKGLAMKFAGALGLTSGIYLAVNAVKKIISTFSDFTAMSSKVQAISGANQEQFEALTNSAKKLGASTAFTATQIAELQLNLSKLGFTPEQITASQSGILSLAAATGEDLAESATVAAATLKGFGLEADEMGRVADVMASSFSKSALDLSKFATAMPKVAPVAKALGFSLEETTALLGKLSDAGFEASTAATSVRNIFLNLADSNGKLAKSLGKPVKDLPSLIAGLKELKEKGVDLGEALQLTDKRSVAAFQTFLDGADSITDLSDELDNAAGSADAMAKIMLDNLAGDTAIAKSAMEGLAIAIGKKLEPVLRGATRGLTKFIGFLREGTSAFSKLNDLNSELSRSMSEQADILQNNSNEIEGLTKRYDELLKITEPTEEQQEELRSVIDKIVEIVPDAATEIDKYGKALKINTGIAKEFVIEQQKILDQLKDLTVPKIVEDLSVTTKEIAKLEQELIHGRENWLGVYVELTKVEAIQNKISIQNLKKRRNLTLDLLESAGLEENKVIAAFAGQFEKSEIHLRNKLIGIIRAYYLQKRLEIRKAEKEELEVKEKAEKDAKLEAERLKNLAKTYADLKKEISELTKQLTRETFEKNANRFATSKLLITKKTELKLIDDEIKKLSSLKKEEEKITSILAKYKKELSELNKLIELKAKAGEVDISVEQKSREELEKKIKTLKDYIAGKKEENEVDEEAEERIKRNKDMLAQLAIDAEESRQRELDEAQAKREKEAELRNKALELRDNYNKARNKKNQDALDRDIDAHKRHQDLLRQMASRGSEDAKDNLANEEKRIIEAQARKEKLMKKERRQEVVTSTLKSFNSNLASEGDSTKALVKTIKDMTVLTALVNSLPSFFEGTEDTGKGGNADNKGGFWAINHPRERIMTKEQNKMTEGLTNWELANLGYMHKNLNKDIGIKTDWQSNEKVFQKFDELKSSIENKPQLSEISFDQQNESLIFRIESKNKILRNHIKLNKLS